MDRAMVKVRRQTTVLAVVWMVVLFVVGRLLVPRKAIQVDSLVFDDTANWPQFFRSFWPLDLILTCALSWLLAWSMCTFGGLEKSPKSLRQVPKFLLTGLLPMGALAGIVMTISSGWYRGLEWVVAGSVVAVLTMIVLLVLLVIWQLL